MSKFDDFMSRPYEERRNKLLAVGASIILLSLAGLGIWYYTSFEATDAGKARVKDAASLTDKMTNTETTSNSKDYTEKVKAQEAEEARKAREQGTTHTPSLLSDSGTNFGIEMTSQPDKKEEQKEPLLTRAQQEQMIQAQVEDRLRHERVTQPAAPVNTVSPYEALMTESIRTSLEQGNAFKPSNIVMTKVEAPTVAPSNTAPASVASQEAAKASIPSGSMLYAIIEVSANSDQPNTPVLAHVSGGEWSGAKAVGGFRRENERLVIQFSKLVKNGVEYKITGYAINTKDYSPGVASSVDTHFLSRWGALIAASLLEGFGDAVSRSGTTYVSGVTSDRVSTPKYDPEQEAWIAAGKVGERAANQVEKNFAQEPTVKVDPGTQIGILVL